jgi:hypothetical protein
MIARYKQTLTGFCELGNFGRAQAFLILGLSNEGLSDTSTEATAGEQEPAAAIEPARGEGNRQGRA